MRQFTIAILSVLVGFDLCTYAPTQSRITKRERLCPIDEGGKDPSFVAFRTALRGVVERKDSPALIRLIAPDVRVGLDSPRNIRQFIEDHNPADPNSDVWPQLGRILDLGGSFIEPNVFCAPYVRCPGPKTIDSELFVVILGQKVPAHDRPTSNSQVVERLSCDVLRFDGLTVPQRPDESAPGWIPVFLGSRWAFVEVAKTRMVDDWYIHATKTNGRWLITTFLAG
jgi:hypothetical protein